MILDEVLKTNSHRRKVWTSEPLDNRPLTIILIKSLLRVYPASSSVKEPFFLLTQYILRKCFLEAWLMIIISIVEAGWSNKNSDYEI